MEKTETTSGKITREREGENRLYKRRGNKSRNKMLSQPLAKTIKTKGLKRRKEKKTQKTSAGQLKTKGIKDEYK